MKNKGDKMNTRGQGLVPARLRATGNKGSKTKVDYTTREMVSMMKEPANLRVRVKKHKKKIRALRNKLGIALRKKGV